MRLHITCPACRTVYNTPWECQGKRVHCPCGAQFVIPYTPTHRIAADESPANPDTPPNPEPASPVEKASAAAAEPEPVLRPEELQAALGPILTPILTALSTLSTQVSTPPTLPPELATLTDRTILDGLYEKSLADLQNERSTLIQRLQAVEGQLDEAQKQNRKLEADQQQLRTVNARRSRDFAEVLGSLLPDLDFVDGSIEFMLEELEDYRHVLKVLALLQYQPKVLTLRTFQSVPGWREIDKHISSGQSDDVRVYVKKTNGQARYRVLVSRKVCQDRDKKRMQMAG